MKLDKDNGVIKIYVGDNKKNINKIIKTLKNYQIFLNKNNNKKILGLDFEFNSKVIALAQLYLENYPSKESDIVLVFNPTSDKDLEKEFRNTIINENVKVILHGGESLDIPYLFNDLLKSSKSIVKFTKNLIDTKYLCEYDLIKNPIDDAKCKIYYLLKQQNVINKKKFNEILENEEKMGKIYNIFIDVKKLSPELLKYSVYDVIFLPELIRKLDYNSKDNKLVNTIVQLNFLWKNNLIPAINNQKETIDKIFNSYNQNYRLNEKFYSILKQIDNEKIIQLKNINFIKKFIEHLQKIYIFPLILEKEDFYYSTDNKVNKNIIKEIDLPSNIKSFLDKLIKKI